MKSALLAAMMGSLLLTGCSLTGRSGAVTEEANGCAWTSYIFVSKDDQLTEETATDILAHNEARKEKCGG